MAPLRTLFVQPWSSHVALERARTHDACVVVTRCRPHLPRRSPRRILCRAGHPPAPAHSSSSSSSSSASSNTSSSARASLHELTERIADLLDVAPHVSQEPLFCAKETPLSPSSTTTSPFPPKPVDAAKVVVILGKTPIDGQISLEHARRIVALIKQIKQDSLPPQTVIAFTGGPSPDGPQVISAGALGYSFFMSLTAQSNIDVSSFKLIVDPTTSAGPRGLGSVIAEVRHLLGPDALIGCRFTFISSDYHLFQVQEDHRLSPRNSLLHPLQSQMSTWHYVFAFYPFCVSQDPVTAFLGRVTVLNSELVIVLHDLNNVITGTGFFNAENSQRLLATASKLRDMTRLIQSPRAVAAEGGFKTDMRQYCEILESCSHGLRQVSEILVSMGDVSGRLNAKQLGRASVLLQDCITRMSQSFDPDHPVTLANTSDMIEEIGAMGGATKKVAKKSKAKPARAADLDKTQAHVAVKGERKTKGKVGRPRKARPINKF